MVKVLMNHQMIAEFNGSDITGLSGLEEAKLYLASLQKLYPEAKIEQ